MAPDTDVVDVVPFGDLDDHPSPVTDAGLGRYRPRLGDRERRDLLEQLVRELLGSNEPPFEAMGGSHSGLESIEFLYPGWAGLT